MKKKIISMLLIFAIVIITQTGCGKEEQVSKTEFYLDTNCTITLYNIEKSKGDALIEKSFGICDKYEKILSKTIENSDVYKINNAKGKFVKVNESTLEIIKNSIKLSELSDGAFDITIGRLTDIWDFKTEKPKVPSDRQISEAVKTVDYKKISIAGNKVKLENPEAKIDLGGIAKGYIADKVTQMLQKEGVESAIVNLGGNIVAIGEKTGNKPWKIGIERPYSDRKEVVGTVEVRNKSVVTSGIYERNFTVNGKLYHHIIDTKTGYPSNSNVEAVSIVGDIGNSMYCDGYSTICLLLGSEKGKVLIESLDNVEAVFIDKSNNIIKTKNMEFTEIKK